MDATKVITSLFGLVVVFGAVALILNNPAQANAVGSATAGTISSVTRALEGR